MDSKEAEKYTKAGKILKEVKENAKKNIKAGQKLIDIAEKIEKEIVQKGAGIAFPVNLSLNEAAAHYTPSVGDETILREEDVLKVDLGTHIDGFIADSAFTINLNNKHVKLIEASEKALENALAIVKSGIEINEISKVIQKTIEDYGFKPVENLTGHGLAQYEAHTAPSINNVTRNESKKIEDNQAYAIEPFATDGKGFVRENQQSEIFAIDEPRVVRNNYAREVLEFAMENYNTLPFAERWIAKELKLSEFQRKVALRELMKNRCIRSFPILKEEKGRLVSQCENTFIVFEGKVKITT